ncbi:putative phage abortive infection protein [Chryseobacterium indoltheticum]|uniref:Phage abortive infection protein n=1 Tax=Chryseobacterium indoltheticum TaxID=254 RepID=A0A381FIL6_9FLAO|nr:putative phage abortive infection protein [Chryseobacterium indoltheticum]AZA74767.1 hypothetical protein EG358_13780 [Chryseobacterium indoltheticum]SIQ36018.1 Putative phage abortive infection protein [Chryseobacterium indoltheticum]SUX45992.1 Uncharacterised protein [Chryseobacterium indoltheticum]
MRINNRVLLLIGCGSAVFMAIVLYCNYMYASSLKKTGDVEPGVFGDMFGASNALFTGLSFVFLIITILLQRQDINDQQKELDRQNKVMSTQNFETTFFNMINVHHEIVNSMQLTHNSTTVEKARGVFLYLFSVIYEKLDSEGNNFSRVYLRYYLPLNYHLDHYYSNLYEIIKYIDESDILTFNLKERYTSILRSQLSEHEKLMIFYRILYYKDSYFKVLLERYDILKNYNYDSIVPEPLTKGYNPHDHIS